MFVTAIHRKRPEPNKSRSIRVLCGGDGEILNLLAPLGASRPRRISYRSFLRLAEISSGSPPWPIKRHRRAVSFLLAEMEECHSCTQHPALLKDGYIISQKSFPVNRFFPPSPRGESLFRLPFLPHRRRDHVVHVVLLDGGRILLDHFSKRCPRSPVILAELHEQGREILAGKDPLPLF